uniref:Uncharacterized protein n=1 Tax=Dicentrarchus labrax TaxID=13489 RepID=A0A8C4DRC1_DICLA
VHNALHSDFTRVRVHVEQFTHLEGCVSAKCVGDLPIRALIQVRGVQLQHQRPPLCVLHQARPHQLSKLASIIARLDIQYEVLVCA